MTYDSTSTIVQLNAVTAERDALLAELAALKTQEPVAEVHPTHLRASESIASPHWCREVLLYSGNSPHDKGGQLERVKLYAAPTVQPVQKLSALEIVDIARKTFVEFEGRDMQFEGIMPWVLAACERTAKAALAATPRAVSAGDALDAQRYRWLRARVSGHRSVNSARPATFAFPGPMALTPVADIMRGSVAQHLDAAIDAAMSDGAALAAESQAS